MKDGGNIYQPKQKSSLVHVKKGYLPTYIEHSKKIPWWYLYRFSFSYALTFVDVKSGNHWSILIMHCLFNSHLAPRMLNIDTRKGGGGGGARNNQ
jgi:membrane protease YdiL (CAAX protease family)